MLVSFHHSLHITHPNILNGDLKGVLLTMLLPELRERVWRLHLELPKNNLVVWTGGNVSARDPETGYMVIKPSGIMYDDLTPENMVILDLDGNMIEGDYKPSSDTYSHLYIYRTAPMSTGWCIPIPVMRLHLQRLADPFPYI
jgi:ribulose-5-phosphate 4-epimerase/fuculose-1-phosphate aldolase